MTFYRVNITQSFIARYPAVCVPFEPCQCTMPAVGEVARISISVTNCGDQEGPTIALEAQARLPSPPSECWSLPVYNYTSDLTGICFQWMRANVSKLINLLHNHKLMFHHGRIHWSLPQEYIRTLLTSYSVSVSGDAVQTIPATTACPTVNCSHLFPLSLPILSLRGDVSASNVIGPGPSCPIQMEVGKYNSAHFKQLISLCFRFKQSSIFFTHLFNQSN